MRKAEFLDWLEGFADNEDGQPIVYPNLKDVIIGIVERFGMTPVILYDREKVIKILMADGMDEDAAEEWYGFNTLGTWAGEGTPAFATLIREETDGNEEQGA